MSRGRCHHQLFACVTKIMSNFVGTHPLLLSMKTVRSIIVQNECYSDVLSANNIPPRDTDKGNYVAAHTARP